MFVELLHFLPCRLQAFAVCRSASTCLSWSTRIAMPGTKYLVPLLCFLLSTRLLSIHSSALVLKELLR